MRGRDFGGADFEDDDLVELERAEAMLDRRDPDQAEELVAARRKAERERVEREAKFEQLRVASEKRKRVLHRRLFVVGVAAAMLAAFSLPVGRALIKEMGRNEAASKSLEASSKPATAVGFRTRKDFVDVPTAGVKLEIPRATCSALVSVAEGSGETPKMRLERKLGSALESEEGLVWCSCEPEEVLVKIVDDRGRRSSVAWVSAPMGDVGGAEALRFGSIPGFRVIADGTGMACSDAAFETWSQRPGRGELEPLPKDREGITATSVAEGAEPAGMLPTGRAFGVVRSERGYCYLAIPERPGSTMSVRKQDGQRIAQDAEGTLGWCSHSASTIVSVWPAKLDGPPILVLRASADRIGGLSGTHELALRRGAKKFRGYLEEDDLAQDTVATLIASTVAEETIIKSDAAGLPEKQGMLVTAFALLPTGAYLPDAVPRVPFACSPRDEADAETQAHTCWQARAQRWRNEGKAKRQAAAQGPTPFWLSVLAGVEDPGALEAAARLLAFARRMRLMGFEPSTVEGVRDSAGGAVIRGRAGSIDTVAVGVTKTAPWIRLLSDGKPWSLTGDLRIFQIPEGKTKSLQAAGGLGGDPEARRVIVWRR